MHKIVDCFSYFNEKELLELRVNLLKDHVDGFIISELNYTHSGKPREFAVKKLIEELNLPKDKIIVIEHEVPEESKIVPSEKDHFHAKNAKSEKEATAWYRERVQRDIVTSVVNRFSEDTLFIMSDCDEIVNPKYLSYISSTKRNNPNLIIKIPLVLLEGRADQRIWYKDKPGHYDAYPARWGWAAFICTQEQLRNVTPTQIRANFGDVYQNVHITDERGQIVQDMGWHLTWMGDENRRKYKAESFIHYANMSVVNNLVLINPDYEFRTYDLTELPRTIFESERLFKFFLPTLDFEKTKKELAI
jgi:hypothetical protein